MNNEFRTVADYEVYLYSLVTEYPIIRHSTLVLVRRGSTLARVEGEILFDHDVRFIVREGLLIDRTPIVIDFYGYEEWEGNNKLYWYDSQPHPNELSLQITHPHHKHIPPNISFIRPNLPLLIREIEQVIAEISTDS